MADKKISQLTAATTPLAGTEVLPIVQSGSTVKVSAADVTAGRAVSAASVAVTGSSAPANGVYLPASNTVGIATNSSTQFRVDSSGRTVLGAASFLNYGGDSTLARSQALISTDTTNTALPVASFVRRTSGTPAAGIGAEIHLCAENNYSNVSQYAVIAGVGTDLVNINGDCVISTMLNNTQTEQVRVTSGGNLKISRAAKGIDFSANTGAPGETSALLNWYEEGTWTPVAKGATSDPTVTYSTQYGAYTRIGRAVHFVAKVFFSAYSGGSGEFFLGGLPYQQLASSGQFTHSIATFNINLGTGRTQAVAWTSQGLTSVFIWGTQNNGANYDVLVGDLTASSGMIIQGTYFVD